MKLRCLITILVILTVSPTLASEWPWEWPHPTPWRRIQQRNTTEVVPFDETTLPGYMIWLNGDIKVTVEKCCPIVFFGNSLSGLPIKDGCLNVESLDRIKELLHIAMYDRMYLLDWTYDNTEQQSSSNPRMVCHKPQDNTYTCHFGWWEIIMLKPEIINAYVFYICDQNQPIDFLTTLGILGHNLTSFAWGGGNCVPLRSTERCSKYNKYSSMPNLIYQKSRSNAQKSLIVSLPYTSDCHKYSEEISCHLFLPQCQGETRTLLCKSTCFEFFTACDGLFRSLLQSYTNYMSYLELIINFYCSQLPDNNCVKTEPVTCESPDLIDNGTHNGIRDVTYPVNSMLRYGCNSGYKLEGNATVICKYSGNWSTTPQCIKEPSDKNLIIICTIFGGFILSIAVVLFLIWKYRQELSALLYVKYGIKFVRETEEKREFDAFIAYSQQDYEFVKQKLMEPLEKMNFKLCLPERDYETGDYKSQIIIKGVQASKRTIIVLSQNFIDSGWCQFEFAQSHLRMLEDESFKLLLVAIDEPRILNNSPQLITDYIESRTYLMKDDRLFLEKILYKMPRIDDIQHSFSIGKMETTVC